MPPEMESQLPKGIPNPYLTTTGVLNWFKIWNVEWHGLELTTTVCFITLLVLQLGSRLPGLQWVLPNTTSNTTGWKSWSIWMKKQSAFPYKAKLVVVISFLYYRNTWTVFHEVYTMKCIHAMLLKQATKVLIFRVVLNEAKQPLMVQCA